MSWIAIFMCRILMGRCSSVTCPDFSHTADQWERLRPIDPAAQSVVFLKAMNELILDGLHITVEKKNIKNMYLRITPPDGRVLLSAPKRMPDSAVERFARQRLPWLKKHIGQYVQSPAVKYESGDTFYLWGVPYQLDVQPAQARVRGARVLIDGNRILLTATPNSAPEARKALLDQWYRTELAAAAQGALPVHEQTVGKRASRLIIRDMTSRWGTCNTVTAAITLNLQLAKREPQFLDYVLIHELTHLHEPGHNARFYTLMDGFYPGWKQVRKQLKRNL